MTLELEGKVAIVTGAGRGIGRAEAIALAAAGARVVVNDLGCDWDGTSVDRRPVDQVVYEIRSAGGIAVANYGDVADMQTGLNLVQQAVEDFGSLDILVNNAGILRPKPFWDLSETDWDLVTSINLKGHFTVTQAAVRVFIARGGGRIINTSSEAGLGMALFANYAAAKEGITGLTRTLALELAPFNILVNQIRPRTADTRMFQASIEAGEAGGARLTEILPGADMQGLFSRPDEFSSAHVAALVCFLCGEGGDRITGADLSVGGGEVTVLSQVRALGSVSWRNEDNAAALEGLLRSNQLHWAIPVEPS